METPFKIYCGDSLAVLKSLPDNSFDGGVMDPPAGIGFMTGHGGWDGDKGGRKQWVAWLTPIMVEIYRVLKPGGHLLCWSLPKTMGWTQWAIEDAGFDVNTWVISIFGGGFPKGCNVSKNIDKRLGLEREITGLKVGQRYGADGEVLGRRFGNGHDPNPSGWVSNGRSPFETAPNSDDAKEWEGWNSGISPAFEGWFLVKKPNELVTETDPVTGREKTRRLTIVENVLKHGTGALNIGATRIPTGEAYTLKKGAKETENCYGDFGEHTTINDGGRVPKNVILSDDPEVTAIFPYTHGAGRPNLQGKVYKKNPNANDYGKYNDISLNASGNSRPGGSASRYFYKYHSKITAKNRHEGCEHLYWFMPDNASKVDIESAESHLKTTLTYDDLITPAQYKSLPKNLKRLFRQGNVHATVKSDDLCQYLVKLITPPNGLVLDAFCGSGSTGKQAILFGHRFIGIDMDPKYVTITEARCAWALKQRGLTPTEITAIQTAEPTIDLTNVQSTLF